MLGIEYLNLRILRIEFDFDIFQYACSVSKILIHAFFSTHAQYRILFRELPVRILRIELEIAETIFFGIRSKTKKNLDQTFWRLNVSQ